jgi:hypothetical protein
VVADQCLCRLESRQISNISTFQGFCNPDIVRFLLVQGCLPRAAFSHCAIPSTHDTTTWVLSRDPAAYDCSSECCPCHTMMYSGLALGSRAEISSVLPFRILAILHLLQSVSALWWAGHSLLRAVQSWLPSVKTVVAAHPSTSWQSTPPPVFFSLWWSSAILADPSEMA